MATALSIIALAIGFYIVVRPSSVIRAMMRFFDKMDILHPPGPVFPILIFLVGVFLVIIGAMNLFQIKL